ncbi:MAG: hypothetical protein KJ709_04075 [Nanoarchaeota archaeon]|nr:hypothetical protein [Nanoarchaeota archaeon]
MVMTQVYFGKAPLHDSSGRYNLNHSDPEKRDGWISHRDVAEKYGYLLPGPFLDPDKNVIRVDIISANLSSMDPENDSIEMRLLYCSHALAVQLVEDVLRREGINPVAMAVRRPFNEKYGAVQLLYPAVHEKAISALLNCLETYHKAMLKDLEKGTQSDSDLPSVIDGFFSAKYSPDNQKIHKHGSQG